MVRAACISTFANEIDANTHTLKRQSRVEQRPKEQKRRAFVSFWCVSSNRWQYDLYIVITLPRERERIYGISVWC